MIKISCLSPKVVYNKYISEFVTVPCGSCDVCTSMRSLGWSNRLELETHDNVFTLFFTLTYAKDKRPVIDVNNVIDFVSDSWDVSLAHSSEYVSLCKGFVPCVSSSDMQGFIKRLRRFIDYYFPNLSYEEKRLRYFIASEYGPTTFHPHYHGLLWFNSSAVSKKIKEFIYKAWFSKNPHSSLSSFLERNQCSFVRYSASQYVAGYLNCDTFLPSILREPLFRTFHLQSSRPPIGSLRIQQIQVQRLFSSSFTNFSFVRPKTGKVVNVPLWRSFESRYFPRHVGFSLISSSDRGTMYRISLLYGCEFGFNAWLKRILSEWNSSLSVFVLLRKFAAEDFKDEETGYPLPNIESLRRLFYVSRRFFRCVDEFGFLPSVYQTIIERYYSRKNYNCLVAQLEAEQALLDSTLPNSSLEYLPFYIDSCFYENLRNLSPIARNEYIKQFNLEGKDWVQFVPSNTYLYSKARSFFSRIRRENTKVRQHKDFVSNHPEYQKIYLQNLFYL